MYGKNNPGRHYCRDWCCFMDIYIFSGGFCAFLGKTAIGAFGGVWCTERDLWVRKKACNPWDYRLFWSWQCDSNTRPADYESAALPTELCQHACAPMYPSTSDAQSQDALSLNFITLCIIPAPAPPRFRPFPRHGWLKWRNFWTAMFKICSIHDLTPSPPQALFGLKTAKMVYITTNFKS